MIQHGTLYDFNKLKIAQHELLEEEEPIKINKCASMTITVNGVPLKCDHKQRIYIPEHYICSFIQDIHKKLSHASSKKLYEGIKKYFTAKRMKNQISEIISGCLKCQLNKNNNKKYGRICGNLEAQEFNETIAVDLLGPFETKLFLTINKANKFYILNMIDCYSRYVEIALVTSISTDEIIGKFTKMWLEKHGKPKRILSDQGRQFVSKEFDNFLKSKNITLVKKSAYNPTGNGKCERINSNILAIMRIYKGESLSSVLEKIKINLNQTFQRSIGTSPETLVYRRDVFNYKNQEIEINLNEINKINEKSTKQNDRKMNKQRITGFEYKISDKVFVKTIRTEKLDPVWFGPIDVEGVDESKNRVLVKVNRRWKWINIKRVRPWKKGQDVVPF
jgi:hypothetical protein